MIFLFRRMPYLLLLFAIALLNGCSTFQQETLTSMDRDFWHLNGRLGYRTPEDGGSASVQWLQQGEQGNIHFSGPLGFGSAELSWTPENASLTTSKGRYQSSSPAHLAEALTGLELPVHSLLWWIRGEPDPGFSSNQVETSQTEDAAQKIITGFTQNGWRLRFDRHDRNQPAHYPGRIRATKGPYRFVFVIQSWEVVPH